MARAASAPSSSAKKLPWEDWREGDDEMTSGWMREGGFCAFEQRHPSLEHGDGRIGEARIEEARFLALEARGALLGAVVHEALSEIERFRRFAERRAQLAGVDETGFGTIVTVSGR